MNNLHGLLFACRSNPALRELTVPRNTCSLPYGGRYRIIDFMLSNLVNAGVSDVGLIVHAGYQSLLDHVGSGKSWDLSRKHGGLRILPPFGYVKYGGEDVYRGRMEALSSVRSYLERIRQDYVVLAEGDIAVNLPLEKLFETHKNSDADITAVCTRIPRSEARFSTYFTVDEDGWISDVIIEPATPVGFESLEIYFLSKRLLLALVDHCATHNLPSFRRDVLSCMDLKLKPCFFDGYAARLQSVESYFHHSMELLDPAVRAELFPPSRGIRTQDVSCPSTYYSPQAKAVHSLIADSCILEGEVRNSILFRGVHIQKGAKISNCILMQGTVVQQDAVLRYAIVDKNVRVDAGRMLMGHEHYPLTIAKNSIV